MPAVTILCTDLQHPIYPYLRRWAAEHGAVADIQIIQRSAEVQGGEILFLVSCHEIIKAPVRDRYRHTLVIMPVTCPEARACLPMYGRSSKAAPTSLSPC